MNTQRASRDAAGRLVRVPATGAAVLVLVTLCGAGALTGCGGVQPVRVAGPVEMGVSSPSAARPTAVPPGTDGAGAVPSEAGTPRSPVAPSAGDGVVPARPTTDAAAPSLSIGRSSTAARSTAPTAAARSAAAARSSAALASSSAARAAASRAGAAASSAAGGAAAKTTRKPSPSTPTGPVLLLGPATESVAEAEVVRLVNVAREAAGCAPVAVSGTLVQLARAHSQDMAGAAGFRHNGSDGRTPFQRMTAAGYDYSMAAENIAAGQPNAAAVMSAWMASEGHKANIVDCRLTQIGVGVVNQPGSPYVVYWTQEFATPM